MLLVNDHVLMAAFGAPADGGGWWTGKLSDVAGLAFFPITLQAAWEVALSAARRPWGPSPRALLVAIGLTGACFSAIQVVPAAGDAYRVGLGTLQAVFRGAYAPAALAADPTDLLALPALGLAWWAGRRRCAVPPCDRGASCGWS